MPTVSIIIPVYNAKKTLNRCIDSVLNQEYTDFELILVNDGSKDESASICDEYAAKDARVKVIHKENSGVSDTRNTGIAEAQGEYLQFMDADDWITADATKLMVREAQERNCELVITDFYRVVGDKIAHKGSIKDEGEMSREEFADCMKDNPADFYYGVLWNKLFRRDIIIEHQLGMDASVSWCEDFLFNLEYLLHVNKVFVLTVPIYYYVKTEGSLVSQSMNVARVVQTKLHVFNYYNKFYKNVYDEKDYKKKRIGIFKYLIDSADDGVVVPSFFPNSKKLGEERVLVADHITEADDYLTANYRHAKILERYFETISIRYELSLNDIKVLAHVSQMGIVKSKNELADYIGIENSELSRSFKILIHEKMLDVIPHKEYFEVVVLEEGKPVLKEIEQAFADYDAVRFQGFTDEEMETYLEFQKRIDENLSRVLKG